MSLKFNSRERRKGENEIGHVTQKTSGIKRTESSERGGYLAKRAEA